MLPALSCSRTAVVAVVTALGINTSRLLFVMPELALLFDLLTREEEVIDNYTREFRFDINLLARRLVAATNWLARENETSRLRPGYFRGEHRGRPALVAAAAELEEKVGAVVSRGGRPDLAGPALSHVTLRHS